LPPPVAVRPIWNWKTAAASMPATWRTSSCWRATRWRTSPTRGAFAACTSPVSVSSARLFSSGLVPFALGQAYDLVAAVVGECFHAGEQFRCLAFQRDEAVHHEQRLAPACHEALRSLQKAIRQVLVHDEALVEGRVAQQQVDLRSNALGAVGRHHLYFLVHCMCLQVVRTGAQRSGVIVGSQYLRATQVQQRQGQQAIAATEVESAGRRCLSGSMFFQLLQQEQAAGIEAVPGK